MSATALAAVRAANGRDQWGPWATHKFLSNRGVPLRLYMLARMLRAIHGPAKV